MEKRVDEVFASHLDEISHHFGDLSSNTLRVWFTATIHQNGALHNPGVALRNIGPSVDFSLYPLQWDLAMRNVTTSSAINSTIPEGTRLRQAGVFDVPNPWHASGTPNQGNAPFDGSACSSPRRDMNFSTSYGRFYDYTTYKLLGSTGIGEEDGHCGPGGSGLEYIFGQNSRMNADQGVQLVAFQLRDGGIGGGRRIYQGLGIRPRGFLPPSLETVLTRMQADYPQHTEQSLMNCGLSEIYLRRVEAWHSSGESALGLTFEVVGWAEGYDDTPRRIPATDFVWSDAIGNYASAGTGDGGGNPGGTASPHWDYEKFYVTDGQRGASLGFDNYRQFDGIM
jgi:hypothetical protein